jgi:hypothetical protein
MALYGNLKKPVTKLSRLKTIASPDMNPDSVLPF